MIKVQDMIFREGIADPLGCHAGSYEEGAISILMGIAANKSVAEKRNVMIGDLVTLSNYRKGKPNWLLFALTNQ